MAIQDDIAGFVYPQNGQCPTNMVKKPDGGCAPTTFDFKNPPQPIKDAVNDFSNCVAKNTSAPSTSTYMPEPYGGRVLKTLAS